MNRATGGEEDQESTYLSTRTKSRVQNERICTRDKVYGWKNRDVTDEVQEF